MRIRLRGVIVFIFTSLLCISCTDSTKSISIALPPDVQDAGTYPVFKGAVGVLVRYAPLKALNRNAQKGMISTPEKSGTMCYAFEKSPEMLDLTGSSVYALALEFEPLSTATKSESEALSNNTEEAQADGTVSTGSAEFAVGLLYGSDFSASGKLKKNIRPQYPVTAQTLPHEAFTVSIGFAGIVAPSTDIRGFTVHSQAALRLKSAAIVPVRYGWLKETVLWYGTTADGGVIPPELCTGSGMPAHTELPKPTAVLQAGNIGSGRDRIVIHFDSTVPIELSEEQKQPRLSFQCGENRISVFRAPNIYRLTLDGCFFSDPVVTLEQPGVDGLTERDDRSNTAHTVSGITTDYYTPTPQDPITADPGLILNWPQTHWRQPSYELFVWEQFPTVLIFDFADYSIQNAYFKRLSFFAEKKGFTGKLLSEESIRTLHGFNAHDYRAETLAAFFQKADEEQFPLNKSELQLRTILFHNGIIVRTEQGIEAGNGAVLSLSRQSSPALRRRFITHECLHGIYFTEKRFRDATLKAFQQTDLRAVLFLRRYFEISASLSYNTDDEYLFQNEFMAYLLQQDISVLQQYYNRIAWFQDMNATEPELCQYMRDTNAAAFMQAAAQMSSSLYTTWGLKGGRIHLAKREPL